MSVFFWVYIGTLLQNALWSLRPSKFSGFGFWPLQ